MIPLALTASLGAESPSLHHDVRAFVTGYNTIPGQTDSTPCIAARRRYLRPAGRRRVPRRIGLGTIVEIRGTTYVCEDRLAKKFDSRFDISCDKDIACPYHVAGWTTIKVYGEERSAARGRVEDRRHRCAPVGAEVAEAGTNGRGSEPWAMPR